MPEMKWIEELSLKFRRRYKHSAPAFNIVVLVILVVTTLGSSPRTL